MEKSWSQLSDRCNLFFEAQDGLYKELLKEAEEILVNRCGLLKQKFTYQPQSGSEHNAFALPLDYKSMIGVWVDGDLIKQVEKTQWDFNQGTTTYNPVMTVDKGTPNYYSIINNMITLDKIPSTSNTIDIFYQASIEEHLGGKKAVLIENVSDTSVRINTSYKDDLIGKSVKYIRSDGSSVNSITITSVSADAIDNYHTTSQRVTNSTSGDINEYGGLATMNTFVGSGNWSTTGENSAQILQGWVDGWRDFSPIIESDFHINLCDYAIYVASAKTNPELSMKHQQMWEQKIRETINDNIDRELPIGIKEEI